MLGLVILLFIIIAVIYVSYENLDSFKRKITKVLIIILLFILIFIMQISLIYFSFSNNDGLGRTGQGELILIILIPIIIVFTEAVLMLLYTYLINKYNKKEISRKRFIIYVLLILFINSVSLLLIY